MKLRDLLADQGVDPELLLDQLVGRRFDNGGITVSLSDGMMDLHVLIPVADKAPPEVAKPKPKRKRKS